MAVWSRMGHATRSWPSSRVNRRHPQRTATRSQISRRQLWCKSPMPSSEFAFANDIRAAAALRTPRTSRMLLFAFLALLLSFLVWAHFAVLDEVKRGNGRVVPSRQTQVVQTLEGGIVGDILVQEGAIVQQGQSLMRIDDTKFASEFGEIRERRAAMAARVARLEAEARGRSEVTFPDQLDQVVPASVATESSVFKMRAQKVAQDVDVLNQQVTRLSGTLEMLRLDRQATEMRGQLAEAQSKIANTLASFRSQADEDLAKSKGDLAVLDENIKSAQDRVRRTDLKAPVHGIVNKLNVTTIGAVVQPGANVMDIIPLD